jgi:hypothetical protein
VNSEVEFWNAKGKDATVVVRERVEVGRVRVFEEFLTVFNCSVLTFWSAIKFLRE